MLRAIKKRKVADVRAAVTNDGSWYSVARVTAARDARPRLSARSFEFAITPTGTSVIDLQDLDIRKTPVSAVLNQGEYQMQLIEKPNVPDAEIRQALSWRVREFIDYPVDQASLDLFDLPRQSTASARDVAYAVIARNSTVDERVVGSRVFGPLSVDAIDIPELCLRNIAARLPDDQHGTALLHFLDDDAYLIITRAGQLHVVRHISSGRRVFIDNADDDFFIRERVSGIALEVQRSLDYYESHYDYRPISRIVLGPGEGLDALPALLQQDLGVAIERLELGELFELENELSEAEQGYCLLAIGAALRESNDGGSGQRINLLAPEEKPDLAEFPARFMLQGLAAAVALMALLSVWAGYRVAAIDNEIIAATALGTEAVERLANLRAELDAATGGRSWSAQLDEALAELQQRQAVLSLVQSSALGDSDGFARHMRALSRQNVDGMWLTYIALSSGGEHTRLEGRTIKAELIPRYLQALITEGPFSTQRFHQFQIDNPVDVDGPALVFAMDSSQPGVDIVGGRK